MPGMPGLGTLISRLVFGGCWQSVSRAGASLAVARGTAVGWFTPKWLGSSIMRLAETLRSGAIEDYAENGPLKHRLPRHQRSALSHALCYEEELIKWRSKLQGTRRRTIRASGRRVRLHPCEPQVLHYHLNLDQINEATELDDS